jgi:hypothetical protein
MTRGTNRLTLTAALLAVGAAGGAAAAPAPRRKYYDPGAAPQPTRKVAVDSKPIHIRMTRQARRQIEREIRFKGFDRARREAAKHGWAVPTLARLRDEERVREWEWRGYWLDMLSYAVAVSRGAEKRVLPTHPAGYVE